LNRSIEDLLGAHHKLIMDPVHGGIPLLRQEVAIVDHALFQRLRFICQNDILSLVFPGATHSRFLHSIGAMHVAGRMFRALIENTLKHTTSDTRQLLTPEVLDAISYFHRLVRCACLLHDSGHCSFSHQFNRTPVIRQLLARPGRFEQLWQGVDIADRFASAPDELHHEHYSIRVAHQILREIDIEGFGLCGQDILALMETTHLQISGQFAAHGQALWRLIGPQDQPLPDRFADKLQRTLQSIVSGELDADRADYMLRDGFHSSVTIGGFNLDHLLSNLHFGFCSQTGWIGLAIADKGLGSLEDFVYSRHQMYRQVYAHKTAQGFDWLLRSAIEEVMSSPETRRFVDRCLSDITQFKNLTDNYFWEAFRRHAEINDRSCSRYLLERIKLKHLASRTNLSTEEIQHYREFLAREYGCTADAIIASSITARFTRIRDDFDQIKVLVRDARRQLNTLKLIAQSSQFFSKFSDDKITHFYHNPLFRQEPVGTTRP
jgi:HD superfamily phosphohydrolase